MKIALSVGAGPCAGPLAQSVTTATLAECDNPNAMTIEQAIVEAARREGFVLVGFARLRRLRSPRGVLTIDGSMRIATRTWPGSRAIRAAIRSARRLDSRLRSVVESAYPYVRPRLRRSTGARSCADESRPTDQLDYHDRVLQKSRSIAGLIAAMRPGASDPQLRRYRPGVRARMGRRNRGWDGWARTPICSIANTGHIFSERDLHRYRNRNRTASHIAIIVGRVADASTCVRRARSPTVL